MTAAPPWDIIAAEILSAVQSCTRSGKETKIASSRTTGACAAAVALFLAGCAVLGTTEPEDRPEWASPSAADLGPVRFISAVGMADAREDSDAAVREADRRARQKLADAVVEHARGTAGEFLAAETGAPLEESTVGREFVEMVAAEAAAHVLRHSMRTDTWEDPAGRRYVFYRVPLALVYRAMADRARETLAHTNPLGAAAEGAPERMHSFLTRRLGEQLKEQVRARPAEPEVAPEQRTPAWLELGRHEDYPGERYLTAIGVGSDPAEAELSSRSELRAHLQGRLARLTKSLAVTDAADALARNARALGTEPPVFADADLPAAVPVDTWHDPVTNTHYAYTAVDRTVVSILYPQKVSQVLQRYGDLTNAGRNQQKAGNYTAALRDMLDAVHAARSAVQLQLKALILAPEADAGKLRGLVAEPILDQAVANVRMLLQDIRVDPVGGTDRWAGSGGGPGSAVEIRVTAGPQNVPVTGLPVVFHAPGRAWPELEPVITDAQGAASWQASGALPEHQGSCTITAALALGALSAGADTYGLDFPAACFQCVLRSQANTRFAVAVVPGTAGGTAPESAFAQALQQALAAEGFALVPGGDVQQLTAPDALTWDSSDGQVLAAFASLRASMSRGTFLAVVLATAEAQTVQTVDTTEGALYIVHCPYRVRVLDADLPGESKVVVDLAGTGKGGYAGDSSEAARRAWSDAATCASAQLVEGVKSRFAGDGSEP